MRSGRNSSTWNLRMWSAAGAPGSARSSRVHVPVCAEGGGEADAAGRVREGGRAAVGGGGGGRGGIDAGENRRSERSAADEKKCRAQQRAWGGWQSWGPW